MQKSQVSNLVSLDVNKNHLEQINLEFFFQQYYYRDNFTLSVYSESLKHVSTNVLYNKAYEKAYGMTCLYLNIKMGCESELL